MAKKRSRSRSHTTGRVTPKGTKPPAHTNPHAPQTAPATGAADQVPRPAPQTRQAKAPGSTSRPAAFKPGGRGNR